MHWPDISRRAALPLIAAVGAGALGYLARRRGREEPSGFEFEELPRSPAPSLTVVAADGSRGPLLAGAPLLLHFWATWCPPCRAELPALLALGRELQNTNGPRLLALSVDHEWGAVRAFFGGNVPPEVVMDAAGRANATYRLEILPETFLIAADGTLRLRFVGAQDWRGDEPRDVLRAALL